MALDLRSVIRAAVEAAIDEVSAPLSEGAKSMKSPKSLSSKPKKRGLPAGRAMLLGAGLMTAGRLATGGRARHALDALGQRLENFEERYLEDE